jgi:hypothetical protein
MVTLKKSTGMETVLVESGAEGTGQKVQLEEITRSSKRGPQKAATYFPWRQETSQFQYGQ